MQALCNTCVHSGVCKHKYEEPVRDELMAAMFRPFARSLSDREEEVKPRPVKLGVIECEYFYDEAEFSVSASLREE